MTSKRRQKSSVPDRHRKRIALDTLRMSDVAASFMGGMTKDQAREFLCSIGYSMREVAAIEGKGRTND